MLKYEIRGVKCEVGFLTCNLQFPINNFDNHSTTDCGFQQQEGN